VSIQKPKQTMAFKPWLTQRFFDMTLEKYKDIFNGNIHGNSSISNTQKEYFELQKKEYENLKVAEDILNELRMLVKK
jgi:hypothetical protein